MNQQQPRSSKPPYTPVCRKCKSAYASEFDGLCSKCRGCTAWEAKQRIWRKL